MIAKITVHIDRVFNVIAIEGYGILTDRAGEWEPKKTYLVVVKVYICEDIFQNRIQNIARFEQLVDARTLLTHDDILLCLGAFTIQVLRNRLVNRQGKNQFMIVGLVSIWSMSHCFLAKKPLSMSTG